MNGRAARGNSSVAAGVAALALFLIAGAVLIGFYVSGERERDLRQWESRLRLAADARVDSIVRLISAERRGLEETANNASLQFYLWQIGRQRAAGDLDDSARVYLRNLLLAAAERSGHVPDPAAAVPANLPRPPSAGLALLDASLESVVVTPGFGTIDVAHGRLAERAMADGATQVDLLVDAAGRVALALAVPVGPPPGSANGGAGPVGVLLASRGAAQELLPLLRRGASFAESSETLLVRRNGDSVLLLSALGEGTGPPALPLDGGRVAEAAAALDPGRFVMAPDRRGREVLQVSRTVRGQDWVLVEQVDAVEALRAADERRSFLLAALSLLLLFIAASVVAAWRHGSSVRARQHAEELEEKAEKLQRRTDLLHAISDNIDVLTLLTTREHEVLFTNQATALAVHVRRPDLVGQNLSGIFGADPARQLHELTERAWKHGGPLQDLLQIELDDGPRTFQASFIPIDRLGDREGLTLVVLNDVTDLQRMEARHAELLRRLVATLAHVVDQRDPYAAEHTRRMAQVADAVARELALDDREREQLDLAATLANIGKIMIPSEILTKKDPLTAAEQELLRKHVDYTLELLHGVEFDGPVLDIIAQKQERLDGTGYPRGLTEHEMSMAGRILSVANAFVALISARAYRDGVSVDEALQELMSGAGTRYDRRVIAALYHVAENRLDLSDWRT